MLRKLFKYDFKSLARILLPLYAATLVVGILSSLLTRFTGGVFVDTLVALKPSWFALVIKVVYFFLFGGTCIMSVALSILRFKNNLLGSEGYLTNVLPVSAETHILSKTLSATVWQCITGLFACLSIFLSLILRYGLPDWARFAQDTSLLLTELSALGMGSILLFCLQMLGLLLCGILLIAMTNLMFYASLSVGHTANNHKLAFSVLTFIGFYVVSQGINIFALNGYIKFIDAFCIEPLSSFEHGYIQGYLPVFVPFLLYTVFYSAAYFLISRYFLSKKLNLE